MFDIIIPTHNRLENIQKVLDRISTQSDHFNCVYILIEPGTNQESIIRKYLDDKNFIKFIIVENKVNLGTDASILRTFELSDAKWVFLMGDSKLPVENFAEIIRANILNCDEVKALHFSWDSDIPFDTDINSIVDLTTSGYTFGDFILAGNFVYSHEVIQDYLRDAYRVNSSRIGHVAMPLMLLKSGGKIRLLSGRIIELFLQKPASYRPGLAWADCLSSFHLLTLLPLSYHECKSLNKWIISIESFSDKWMYIKYSLIKIHREKIDMRRSNKLIWSLRFMFNGKLGDKFVLSILSLISRLKNR